MIMRSSNSKDRGHAAKVLGFWHKVEFFIPFDLQGQVLDDAAPDRPVIELSRADLAELGGTLLAHARSVKLEPGKAILGYDLFLNCFDKGEVADLSRELAGDPSADSIAAIDQQERSDIEGRTCFARLSLDAQGHATFEEISVSTVPWAIGRVRASSLGALDSMAFDEAKALLQQELRGFRREASGEDADGSVDDAVPMTCARVLSLLSLLEKWAGYAPRETTLAAAVLRVRIGVERKDRNRGDEVEQPASTGEEEPDGGVGNADVGDDEIRIDILNSFYLGDLEGAAASLAEGTAGPALRAYLASGGEEGRIDVFSGEGRAHLRDRLAPGRLPAGRWPAEPAHAMSLMQQFAVNTAFAELGKGGVLGINGPPGTGKTTMLRDMIAGNIVARAEVLAGLPRARDAFKGETSRVEFEGAGESRSVRTLVPALTGFEMVVASSNNTAVNNISQDLPKTEALGKSFRKGATGKPGVGYLQPVAHKIAAQTARGGYRQLSAAEEPWGLISAALGNSTNRNAFAERFSFGPRLGEKPPANYDAACHQTIWEWRKAYAGPSFSEAKASFQELSAKGRAADRRDRRRGRAHALRSSNRTRRRNPQACKGVEASRRRAG